MIANVRVHSPKPAPSSFRDAGEPEPRTFSRRDRVGLLRPLALDRTTLGPAGRDRLPRIVARKGKPRADAQVLASIQNGCTFCCRHNDLDCLPVANGTTRAQWFFAVLSHRAINCTRVTSPFGECEGCRCCQLPFLAGGSAPSDRSGGLV
jgi:hypothetical protein